VSNILNRSGRVPAKPDNAQYLLTASVIAVMLFVVGLPFYFIFFLGGFSYFLYKVFKSEIRGESRQIFDFYLVAAEILRSDGRLWYGFELQEAIGLGEKLIKNPPAPQLVQFALGALYHKVGDHATAIHHLEPVIGPKAVSEIEIVSPTDGLREYVRLLRKIERQPAEAPQLSAAIRSLERLRRSRGSALIDECRSLMDSSEHGRLTDGYAANEDLTSPFLSEQYRVLEGNSYRNTLANMFSNDGTNAQDGPGPGERSNAQHTGQLQVDRKSISELLQDIYDDKVQ